MNYFITAIGTDCGKTLASAILTEALQADYWKPVQSGSADRDSDTVRKLINNGHSLIHPEAYLLREPKSPHTAAAAEGKEILLDHINLPETHGNHLIIEGAGGVLVPLNKENFVIDLAEKFKAQVILISNIYLGSINHTLLTINELRRRNIPVKGIIFNGTSDQATEDTILKYSAYKCLLRILPEDKITQEVVTRYAIKLFENWDD